MKGQIATIGITPYILKKLGTLVYLDLAQVGDELLAGIAFGEVESLTGISELTCPLEGTIIRNNKHLFEGLDTLSKDPYKDGWLTKLRIVDVKHVSSLMTADEYKKYVGSMAKR